MDTQTRGQTHMDTHLSAHRHGHNHTDMYVDSTQAPPHAHRKHHLHNPHPERRPEWRLCWERRGPAPGREGQRAGGSSGFPQVGQGPHVWAQPSGAPCDDLLTPGAVRVQASPEGSRQGGPAPCFSRGPQADQSEAEQKWDPGGWARRPRAMQFTEEGTPQAVGPPPAMEQGVRVGQR